MRRPALKTFAVSSLGLMIVAASVSCSGASDYVMAPPEFPGRSAPCRVTWSGSQVGSRVIDTIQVTEINGNRIGFEPCPIGYRTSFGQLRFTVFVRGDCRQIGSFNYSPTTCNSGSGNDQWRVFRRFPNVTDIWYPVGSGFYRWAPAPAGAPVLRYDASVSLTITSEADSSRDSIVIGFDHRRVDNSLAAGWVARSTDLRRGVVPSYILGGSTFVVGEVAPWQARTDFDTSAYHVRWFLDGADAGVGARLRAAMPSRPGALQLRMDVSTADGVVETRTATVNPMPYAQVLGPTLLTEPGFFTWEVADPRVAGASVSWELDTGLGQIPLGSGHQVTTWVDGSLPVGLVLRATISAPGYVTNSAERTVMNNSSCGGALLCSRQSPARPSLAKRPASP